MRQPLARQILLPMVGILLVTVVLAGALNAWLASRRVDRQIERQLQDVVRSLSSSNFPLEDNVLRQASGMTGADFVVSSLAGQPGAASKPDLKSLVRPSDRSYADVHKLLVDYIGDRRILRRVVTLDRRPVGGAQQLLHVFYPDQHWREAYWSAIWPPVVSGGAAALLIALAAYAIAHRVTRPIAQLQTQVARIAHGDFEPVAAPARDDEVRDLALAVNRMADQLVDYEAKTRQQERMSTLGTLGAGIAHQIRNAATGCRIALDLHERDCPLSAQQNDEAPLAVAVRQLALIETYVKQFLTLGRPAPAERSQVALAEVVRQAIALVGPAAKHTGAEVQSQLPLTEMYITGHAESLGQMLVNLLVNAVQASAEAGVLVGKGASDTDCQIVVRLDRAGSDRCRISVGDAGPGPDAAIQERLFEPFATDKAGGTGLGLVVSRQIAEDHGGRIWWERRDERTWFIVELPLAKCDEQIAQD